MKKFLVLFSAPTATREKMQSATPEEMQSAMKPWMDWFASVGNALVDRGMPLTHAMGLTKTGIEPGNPDYVAYDIVQAESIDEALTLMKSNPHLEREGGKIEIHEMWDMNGMLK
ncbi:MAG: hypothetical protein KGJ07_05345 [Patescibacteria group bacterium]|nr:hypothetical protein [Patescibacteria group bacterium]MDE2590015.1 hypothetical protein [Patescibacteria group bacterium]